MTQLTVYGSVPNALDLITGMGEAIAKSRLLQCENIEQGKVMAMACIAKGCDPLSLAETYDIIQGRLSMKADAMLAGFEDSGGSYEIKEYSPAACKIVFRRGRTTLPIRITWDDAKQEKWPFAKDGKTLKDNWSTPIGRQDMLWARVVSRGVRRLAPGVVCGRYTPEEVADFSEVGDSGEVPSAVAADAARQPPADFFSHPGSGDGDSSSIVDAEYTVTDAPDPGQGTSAPIGGPATEMQRQTIIGLMKQLKQDGVEDIGRRVADKLQQHEIEGILGLTMAEADALIKALQMKSIETWVGQALVGHKRASEDRGNG